MKILIIILITITFIFGKNIDDKYKGYESIECKEGKIYYKTNNAVIIGDNIYFYTDTIYKVNKGKDETIEPFYHSIYRRDIESCIDSKSKYYDSDVKYYNYVIDKNAKIFKKNDRYRNIRAESFQDIRVLSDDTIKNIAFNMLGDSNNWCYFRNVTNINKQNAIRSNELLELIMPNICGDLIKKDVYKLKYKNNDIAFRAFLVDTPYSNYDFEILINGIFCIKKEFTGCKYKIININKADIFVIYGGMCYIFFTIDNNGRYNDINIMYDDNIKRDQLTDWERFHGKSKLKYNGRYFLYINNKNSDSKSKRIFHYDERKKSLIEDNIIVTDISEYIDIEEYESAQQAGGAEK